MSSKFKQLLRAAAIVISGEAESAGEIRALILTKGEVRDDDVEVTSPLHGTMWLCHRVYRRTEVHLQHDVHFLVSHVREGTS